MQQEWSILYKSDETGGAWWVLDALNDSYSFKPGGHFKIYGIIYYEDSEDFQLAWHLSIWDSLKDSP